MTRLEGRLVLPQGVVAGRLEFGETLTRLEADVDASGPLPAPRLYRHPPSRRRWRRHHGRRGRGADARPFPRAARHHDASTRPRSLMGGDAVLYALGGVKEVQADADPTLPSIPGVHLEGPFISPDRLGRAASADARAHPNVVRRPARLRASSASSTLAPEVRGVTEAARRFTEAGVRISVGHTTADAETVAAFAETVRGGRRHPRLYPPLQRDGWPGGARTGRRRRGARRP